MAPRPRRRRTPHRHPHLRPAVAPRAGAGRRRRHRPTRYVRYNRASSPSGGKTLGRRIAVTATPSFTTDCREEWCPGVESNYRHHDFQSCALPTELPGHRRTPAYRGEGRSLSRWRSGFEIVLFEVVRRLDRRDRVGAGKPAAEVDLPAPGGAERPVFGLAGPAADGAGVAARERDRAGSRTVTHGPPRYRKSRARRWAIAPGRFAARESPRARTSRTPLRPPENPPRRSPR